jgi:hypothetical protein
VLACENNLLPLTVLEDARDNHVRKVVGYESENPYMIKMLIEK